MGRTDLWGGNTSQLVQSIQKKLFALPDETLVIWGGEFGRAPTSEGQKGRDHDHYGFTVWMAGGGIKGGIAHGATDELGFHAVENRHYVTDVHATLLHQLGLDPRRLHFSWVSASEGTKWQQVTCSFWMTWQSSWGSR